jgi:hypothetical protein
MIRRQLTESQHAAQILIGQNRKLFRARSRLLESLTVHTTTLAHLSSACYLAYNPQRFHADCLSKLD